MKSSLKQTLTSSITAARYRGAKFLQRCHHSANRSTKFLPHRSTKSPRLHDTEPPKHPRSAHPSLHLHSGLTPRQHLAILATIIFAVSLSLFIVKGISADPSTANSPVTNTTNTTLIPEPNPITPPTADDIIASLQELLTPDASGFLDLQPVIDAWVASLNPKITVSLLIYDLDHNRIAAAHDPDRPMNVASIYKLFYAYSGYRQIENSPARASAHLITTSDYRAGRYTFADCLDLMIRESYNGCAEAFRSDPAQTNHALAIIDEIDAQNTSEAGLISTASDLVKLLQLYYTHPDLSNSTWATIADSLLNQPPTKINDYITYDWRQGLPAGFSSAVKVYNKVGWDWINNTWTTYADAALLEFPARHYAIAVITSGIINVVPTELHTLGQLLERAIIPTPANV